MNKIFKDMFFKYAVVSFLLIISALIALVVIIKSNYEEELKKDSVERINYLLNDIANFINFNIDSRIKQAVMMDLYNGYNFANTEMVFYNDNFIERLYLLVEGKFLKGFSKYDIVTGLKDDIKEDIFKGVCVEDGKLTYVKLKDINNNYSVIYYVSIAKLLQTFSANLPKDFNLCLYDEARNIIFFSDYSIMFSKSKILNSKETDDYLGIRSNKINIKNELKGITETYLATYTNSNIFKDKFLGIFIDNRVIEKYVITTLGKFVIVGAIIFCVSLLFIYIFSKRIAKPIEKLIGQIDSFSEGSLAILAYDYPDNEIRKLAYKFDEVSKTVKAQIAKNETLLSDYEKQSNLLSSMFEFLPSGLVVFNKYDYKILHFNKKFMENTDKEYMEIFKSNFMQNFCEHEFREDFEQLLNNASKPLVYYGVNVKEKFGINYKINFINFYIIYIDFETVMLIFQDVSKEKEMVEQLTYQNKIINEYFNAIPEMAFMKDKNLKYIIVNYAFEDFTGFSSDYVVGLRENDIYPSEFSEKIIKYENDILNNKQQLKYELEVEKRGVKYILEVTKTPILNENNEVEYIVGIARDITEQKKFILEIEKQRNLLNTVMNSLREGIIVIDTQKNIIFKNNFIKRLIFVDEDRDYAEVLGDITNLIRDDYLKNFEEKIELLISDKSIVKVYGNFILLNINGEEKELFYVAQSVSVLESNERLFVITIRDETESNKILNRLAITERSESVTKVVGGIAHDFNNLLSAIYNYLVLYNLEFQLQGQQKEYVDNIFRVLEKARFLSNELLGVTKGASTKKGDANLLEVVKDVGIFVFSGTEINFVNNIPKDVLNVKIDPNQLSQILHNLFLNAAQAINGPGKVEISAETISVKNDKVLDNGNYLKITISDTGKGIDKDKLGKIFEPYFTTKEKGSGLGLYIIKSLIEKSGGKIYVESELGIGTTFSIYLKASADSSTVIKQEDNIYNLEKKNGKILIMDDKDDILDSLKSLLELLGADVVATKDSDEAFEEFEKATKEGKKFDLVITDLTVPGGKGGLDLFTRIRNIDKEVKIILMSGYTDTESVNKYLSLGFSSILSKPFDINSIQKIIDNL